MSVPLILALEPDERQARILSDVVSRQLRADLVLVDSKDAFIEAITRAIPDLILLTTLVSPRDEEEIAGHLRALDNVDHLQTLTIPLMGSSEQDEEETGGGLLRAFRRKRSNVVGPQGCDPRLFAKEIRSYLKRADEVKAERHAHEEAARAAAALMLRQPPAQPEAQSFPETGADPWAVAESIFMARSDDWSRPPSEAAETSVAAESVIPPPTPPGSVLRDLPLSDAVGEESPEAAPTIRQPIILGEPAPEPAAASELAPGTGAAAASPPAEPAVLDEPVAQPVVGTELAAEPIATAEPLVPDEPAAKPAVAAEPAPEPIAAAEPLVPDEPAAQPAFAAEPAAEPIATAEPLLPDEPAAQPAAAAEPSPEPTATAPVVAVESAPMWIVADDSAPLRPPDSAPEAAPTGAPRPRPMWSPAEPTASGPGDGTPELPPADSTRVPPAIFVALTVEERVSMAQRAIDADDGANGGDRDDLETLLRSLRLPPPVAAFAYPRGCRIGQVQLGRAQASTRSVGR